MNTITKQTLLVYNGKGIFNGVTFKVKKLGSKIVTLEPNYSNKLIGLPSFRVPFNERISDLLEGIKEGIYSIVK